MGRGKASKPSKKRKRDDKSDPNSDLKRRKTKDTSTDLFPRGGGSALSGIEIRKLQKETEERLLSEAGGDYETFLKKADRKDRAKERKKKKSAKRSEDDALTSAFITPDLSNIKAISTVRPKNLHVGFLVLAAVHTVGKRRLVVDLPNGLVGTIPWNEVNDVFSERHENGEVALSDVFSPGDLLRTVVVALASNDKKTHKRVQLSVRPSLLNDSGRFSVDAVEKNTTLYGYVSSEEDHGYVVSFGVEDSECRGFLSKKDAAEEWAGKKLCPGSVVNVRVKEVNKAEEGGTHVFKLSLKKAMTTPMSGDQVIAVTALMPGMLVKGVVKGTVKGGVLITFLDFFTGTVDAQHLQDPSHRSGDLEEFYTEGSKLRARLLFVDPEARRIGLTLLPHLVRWEHATEGRPTGDVVSNAVVLSVSQKAGLELLIPCHTGAYAPGYVMLSQASDGDTPQLPQDIKEGDMCECRVTGSNRLDGILRCSLKESVISQEMFSHSDLEAGKDVRGKVVKILPGDGGVLVELSPQITAVVPVIHLADVIIRTPAAKFKIDQKVKGRILSVNADTKRAYVTLKKSLLRSEYPMLTRYEDAVQGLVTEGVVTGIRDNGLLVSFYGNVRAHVPISQVSHSRLSGPEQLNEMFHVGQVVRACVISSKPEQRRMIATLKASPDDIEPGLAEAAGAALSFASVAVGSIVSAVITDKRESSLLVDVGGIRGRLQKVQLADDEGLATKMFNALTIGKKLKRCVVLVRNSERKTLELSMKPMLIHYVLEHRSEADEDAGVHQPPESYNAVAAAGVGQVYPGYVLSRPQYGVMVLLLVYSEEVGVFALVRALSQRAQMCDQFNEPAKAFVDGQSIRARILSTAVEQQKVDVTLKHSQCHSTGGLYLSSLFESQRAVAAVKAGSHHKQKLAVWKELTVGSVVECVVAGKAAFGCFVRLADERFDTISGFVTNAHAGDNASLSEGMEVQGRILDVNPDENILDISLDADFVKATSKKSLKEGKEYKGDIQLVKKTHLVVSVLNGKELLCVGAPDFNISQQVNALESFKRGQSLSVAWDGIVDKTTRRKIARSCSGDAENAVTVGSRPSELSYQNAGIESKDDVRVGMVLQGKVQAVKTFSLVVSLGLHVRGSVHISDVVDEETREYVLKRFNVGDIVRVKVMRITEQATNKLLPISHKNPIARRVIELSMRPSVLATDDVRVLTFESLDKGQIHVGVIHQVTADCLWVHLAPHIRGRVFLLDATRDKKVLDNFETSFKVGCAVRVFVSSFDLERHSIDLSLNAVNEYEKLIGRRKNRLTTEEAITAALDSTQKGTQLFGRVDSCSEKGMVYRVQVAAHKWGRLSFFELQDALPKHPEQVLKIGQIIKCAVLEVHPSIILSTRESRINAGKAAAPRDPVINSIDDLKGDDILRGYVTTANNKGIFIRFGDLTGRVQKFQASDTFITDIPKQFPPLKRVRAKVVSTTDNRVELSMRKSVLSGASLLSLSDIKVGQKLPGIVSSIKPYGILVQIQKSAGVRGLCHRSEVVDAEEQSEEAAEEPWRSKYEPGDYVLVKVLQIDVPAKKLSLGMKRSYFDAEDYARAELEEEEEEGAEGAEEDDEDSEDEAEAAGSSEDDGDSDSFGSDEDVPEGMGAIEEISADMLLESDSDEELLFRGDEDDDDEEEEDWVLVEEGDGSEPPPPLPVHSPRTSLSVASALTSLSRRLRKRPVCSLPQCANEGVLLTCLSCGQERCREHCAPALRVAESTHFVPLQQRFFEHEEAGSIELLSYSQLLRYTQPRAGSADARGAREGALPVVLGGRVLQCRVAHVCSACWGRVVLEPAPVRSHTRRFREMRAEAQTTHAAEHTNRMAEVLPTLRTLAEHTSKKLTSSWSVMNPLKNVVLFAKDTWKQCAACGEYFGRMSLKRFCQLCEKSFCSQCCASSVTLIPKDIDDCFASHEGELRVCCCAMCAAAVTRTCRARRRSLLRDRNVQKLSMPMRKIRRLLTTSRLLLRALLRYQGCLLSEHSSKEECGAMHGEAVELEQDFGMQSSRFCALVGKWKAHLSLVEIRVMNAVLMWVKVTEEAVALLKQSAQELAWERRHRHARAFH
eukprot:TRINITY_DN393_c0_g2_i3.p1 TRINITY_DN393_c0_g2~~TRINITY_DN393_c0_g2_i3.p1  ORF type:complete len:2102 (+),score=678.39 TRINITY_DN393_c0_g2_i3:55-6306(+)